MFLRVARLKRIAAGTSDSHSLIAYINEAGVVSDSTNKVASFHLELTATQTDMSVLPTISTSYANVEKSQIATSITANGEAKKNANIGTKREIKICLKSILFHCFQRQKMFRMEVKNLH